MSAEHLTPFNKLPAEHEAVIKYRPRFLARGGDHLVYEVEGHPETVIKASTFKIKDILIENAERGLPLDSITEETRELIEKEVAEKNAQIRMYREYFGIEHTLPERRLLMRVPISQKIIEEIFKDDWKDRSMPKGVGEVSEVWSAVVIQEKAPQISDPNHRGLYFGGFVEEREVQPDPSEYEQLNAVFLGRGSITQADLELFFRTQDNPDTHALADLISSTSADANLRTTVEDFVRRSVSFAKETGHIMALAGEDNVILYPTAEGGWNYLLVDAIPLYNDPILTSAMEARELHNAGGQLSSKDKAYITRALNFVRTINGLAAALQMEERLSFEAR